MIVTTVIKSGRIILSPLLMTILLPKEAPIICPAAITNPSKKMTFPAKIKYTRDTRLLVKLRGFEKIEACLIVHPSRDIKAITHKEPVPGPKKPL